jgi:hypothetical protein
LDYWNPKEPRKAAVPAPPRTVVPREFDTLVTRTADHPAAKAVEAALRRAQIQTHVTDDGGRVARQVELYVRAADRERACQIAARIFARRKQIKSLPKLQMPRVDPARPSMPWAGDE